MQQDPAKVGHADWTFAKEVVMLDAILQKAPRVNAEVQVVQVGPVVLCGLPAEVFCQYGLTLKASSKFPLTFPVSFANDDVGYIPTVEPSENMAEATRRGLPPTRTWTSRPASRWSTRH